MTIARMEGPLPADRPPAADDPAEGLIVATAGPDAADVLRAARFLAGRLGVVPTVVAAHDPVFAYLPEVGMAPLLPELDAEQRAFLVEDVVKALQAAGEGVASWPLEVVAGAPAQVISHLARQRKARMIVMGIGKHAPLDRVFGSETALQTIRVADRPVLAVAPGFAAPPRHVVVAMDFSPPSIRAAEEALTLLGEGGKMSLVHVRPPAPRRLRPRPEGETGGRYDGWAADMFDRLRRLLAAPPSVEVETVVRTGNPAGEVVELAEGAGADLIAAGSSGLGFIDRLILGSVATQILRRSTVSVLTVPRPSAADVERIERQLVNMA